jgi:hypothetical protein
MDEAKRLHLIMDYKILRGNAAALDGFREKADAIVRKVEARSTARHPDETSGNVAAGFIDWLDAFTRITTNTLQRLLHDFRRYPSWKTRLLRLVRPAGSMLVPYFGELFFAKSAGELG